MGWVQQKLKDHQITDESITPLWNSLRDSIGAALMEFKASVSQPSIDHGDCTARGTLCVRVWKPGTFIEIFLSTSDQTVKMASGGITVNSSTEEGAPRNIACYRLNKDRSGLEFCTAANSLASAEDVAKEVLESFLFDPFPVHVRSQAI